MAATEGDEREVERFFREELVPLADQLSRHGKEFLDTALMGDVPTYFLRRSQRAMRREDFEVGGCTSSESVARDLANLWRGSQDKELALLAPRLASLARTLRHSTEETGEVSSFIYVMY